MKYIEFINVIYKQVDETELADFEPSAVAGFKLFMSNQTRLIADASGEQVLKPERGDELKLFFGKLVWAHRSCFRGMINGHGGGRLVCVF